MASNGLRQLHAKLADSILTVPDAASLPAVGASSPGDVRFAEAETTPYIYDGSSWITFTAAGAVTSVNGLTGVVVLTTDEINEGATNLYYTASRFNTAFAAKSTTDLAEGTNLYFTDERAQDAVGAMAANSSTVTLTYVDGTPSLTAAIVAGSITDSHISPAASIDGSKINPNFIGQDVASNNLTLGPVAFGGFLKFAGNASLPSGAEAGTLKLYTSSTGKSLRQLTADGYEVQFNYSGLTAGRIYTFPDAAATLAGINVAQTWSATQTFTTPVLGAATATSINKVAITAPATSATLTIANGKTLTASNTLTFTGTDSSSVAFGGGGTVAYTANKLSVFASTTSSELAGVISDETGSGALVFGTSPTIDSGTFTTTAGFADGSASVPSIAFTSDADGSGTGIYRVGANSMGFSANGVNIGQYSSAGAWTFGSTSNASINHAFKSSGTTTVDVYAAATSDTAANNFYQNSILVSGTRALPSSSTAAIAAGDLGLIGFNKNIVFSGDSGTTRHGSMTTAGVWTLGPAAGGVVHTINTTTATTATAGGNAAPATVRGFITISINGTNRKIPFYDV